MRKAKTLAFAAGLGLVTLLSCDDVEDAPAADISTVPQPNTEPVVPDGFSGVVRDSMELTPEETAGVEEAVRLNAARNPTDVDPLLRGFAPVRLPSAGAR